MWVIRGILSHCGDKFAMRRKSTANRRMTRIAARGCGCANPAASAKLSPELGRIDPGYPDNIKKEVIVDQTWYADNYDAKLDKWVEGISG
jgi:putative spermidine/putrescine transport system substrate-binding protein